MRRAGALAALALVAAGCGGSDRDRTVTVLAASSLTEVFRQLEPAFEAANSGADLQFSFGGSSDLAQQVLNGAPADVFAAASATTMEPVAGAGLADGEPQVFATNTLAIVVPLGNPAGVTGFADLADPALTLVLCAPQVPCGAAAEAVARSAGVALQPDSEEPDVRTVLAKVQSDEADAGLVYVTDTRTAAVDAVDFPEAAAAVNSYPIAAIADGPQAELGRAFVDFVLGPPGQRVLTEAGFGTP